MRMYGMYVRCFEIETYENVEKNIEKRNQIYPEKRKQICWEIETYENVEKNLDKKRIQIYQEKTEKMCREKEYFHFVSLTIKYEDPNKCIFF